MQPDNTYVNPDATDEPAPVGSDDDGVKVTETPDDGDASAERGE